MRREPSQRDLQHHLACPLRPSVDFLGLFEALQLAANIDQHTGEFRPNAFQGARNSVLRCKHIVAEGRRIGRGPAARPLGR